MKRCCVDFPSTLHKKTSQIARFFYVRELLSNPWVYIPTKIRSYPYFSPRLNVSILRNKTIHSSLLNLINMKLTKPFVLFVLMITFKFSSAQRFDVLGGFNISGFKHVLNGERQDATGNFNFHFGMGAFVPFNAKKYKDDLDSYGVFPSLLFMKRGVSKSTILGPSPANLKLTCVQLDLPVTYLAGAYGIGIGPYGSYAMSGKKKYRVGNGDKEKIDFSNELKRIDYGITVNLQLNIFKIKYDLGLANMGKGSNGSVKSRNFSLSLNIPIVE